MENNFHEEEQIEKSFDLYLFKRLFKYTKPFIPLLLISVLLLVMITAVDLVKPYMIKLVIDDYVNGWDQPLYVTDEKPMTPNSSAGQEIKTVEWQGQYYTREQKNFDHEGLPARQLYIHEGQTFMLNAPIADAAEVEVNADRLVADNTLTAVYEDGRTASYTATPMTQEEYEPFRTDDKRGILNMVSIYVIILFTGFAMNYGQSLLLTYIGQKQVYLMRQDMFKHLQRQSLSFFDKNPVGRLVTRVTNDMNNISEMFTNVLINAFKDIFLLVGTVVIMFQMNARLAVVALSTVPVILIAAYIFRLKARDAHRQVKVKLARINASLSEYISGMKIIQMFKREEAIYNHFDDINKDHMDSSLRETMVFAVFRPTMNIIYAITLALIIWYGGGRAIQGAIELGVLVAFVDYTQQFFRPIFDLSEKFNILQSAMASSERIFMLYDTHEEIENKDNAAKPEKLQGGISFENVSFSYNDDEWVLKDVNFDIKPGETVAFVGATGSGKTTIMSLISRFYDIQKGSIKVDGTDIKDIDLAALRQRIGIVLQDVFLFTGDIRGNIELNKKLTDERLREVIETVNADRFIDKLPEGLDAAVYERGATFSAGQRQLLSFARALAFDPEILILDEATSNIDTETEEWIQDAITKLIEGRTTIIVAHRLSTIQHADKIVVLHKGRVMEVGTHNELLSKQGLYHKLYLLQYK